MIEAHKFARYDILSLLGKGGFGTVYEAYDIKLQRKVAIKIINTGVKASSQARFRREAEICVRLRHPNVITIYDASIENGVSYIAMEKLEAQDLAETIEEKKIPLEEALSFIVQIANAIDYLQSKGILHRDIKPHNIMVTTSNRAILMDFNLGQSDDMTALTETGVVLGTPVYMAPELWLGAPYCLKTEIYALGLVFYEMLTGELISQKAFLKLKACQPISPPSTINEELAKDYDHFIAWVTHPEHEHRCPTIQDFIAELAKTSDKAAAIIDKYNPELSGAKPSLAPTTVIPKAAPVDSKEAPSALSLALMAIMAIFVAYFTYSAAFSPSEQSNNLNDSIELCSLPDGCYAEVKLKTRKKPHWRIVSNNVIVKQGQCFVSGPRWVVQSQGLSGKDEFVLELFSGKELIGSKSFRLSVSPFKKPLQALVGKNKVKLQWQLLGNVEAKVEGKFDGEKEKAIAKGRQEVSFSTHNRTSNFEYALYLGKRKLVQSKIRMGLVGRRNRDHFPEKPRWKTDSFLPIEGGLVVDSINGVSLLAIDRKEQGPLVSRRFRVRSTMISQFVCMISDGDDWFISILHALDKLHFLRINHKERQKHGDEVSARWGVFPGELSEVLPCRNKPLSLASALLLEPGLVLVANISRNRSTETHVIDYRNGKAKILSGPSVGQAEAIWLGKIDNAIACLTSSRGLVIQHTLFFDKEKSKLNRTTEQRLFQADQGGMLLTIGSQADDAPERKRKNKKVELSVCPISDDRWSIRVGRTLSFYRLKPTISRVCGPRLSFPVTVCNRTSTPLQFSKHKVGYVYVLSKNNMIRPSETYLTVINLRKMGQSAAPRTMIGHSSLLKGYEAIVGGVSFWKGNYFVPALEKVLVISRKKARLVDELDGQWRPNYAAVVGVTLFVPTNIRRLLAIDLLDEY